MNLDSIRKTSMEKGGRSTDFADSAVCKKKSIRPWLVDFAIRHVDFVLYLPNGQVKFVLDFFKIF